MQPKSRIAQIAVVFLASLGAGLAVSIAVSALWRCRDEAFACSLDPIFSAAAIVGYGLLAIAVFSVVARQARNQPLDIAAAALIAPVVGVLVYAVIRNGGLEHLLANFERAMRGTFQLYVPLCLTVAVQWLMTRRALPDSKL